MRGRIKQIIPADGWFYTYLMDGGLVGQRLAGFALVEEIDEGEPVQSVTGLIEMGGYFDLADELGNEGKGYVHGWTGPVVGE